jgi:hypothetical protein
MTMFSTYNAAYVQGLHTYEFTARPLDNQLLNLRETVVPSSSRIYRSKISRLLMITARNAISHKIGLLKIQSIHKTIAF